MKAILMILVAAMTGLLCGCNSVVSISPSTTPITSNDTYTKLGYTSGSSTTFLLVGFPFGPDSPSRSARDNAIARSGGNALIEVTEEYNVLNLLVFAFYWTKVEGTAVKFEHKGKEVVR